MKWMKNIAGVVAGIIIFCGLVKGLNYIYVAESDSEWERILWHNFYEDRGRIDNLFLGSSHVYYDIDPFLLDERNGQYNFNLASSGQLMNGTYYLLREADRNNELSHVYIEMYYYNNVKDFLNDNEEPIVTAVFQNWINTDYMESSFNRLAYMLSSTDIEKYPNNFLGFTRYRSHVNDREYIENRIAEKKKDEYKRYEYLKVGHYGENIEYEDEFRKKGYLYTTRELQGKQRTYKQNNILQENPMAETSEGYLRKTIAYCQKKNIPVTLYISPIYELQLISVEDYDNYVDQVREIADEYGVDFYDFNLVKDEYLPIQQTQYFMDVGHLNVAGADMFTDFFYQVMSEELSESEKYFYDSYKQKLQDQDPEVYGIYYRIKQSEDSTEQDKSVKKVWIASNKDSGMEYKIVMISGDGEQTILQDFSENKEFTIDAEGNGTCIIEYRQKDIPDEVRTIEIEY